MAWALVASSATQSSNGSVASFTRAVGAATAIGDRIFCVTSTYKSGAVPTTPTVADSLNSGNYTEDAASTFTDGAFQARASVWSHTVTVAGTPTLTITPTTNNGGTGCVVWAVSGLNTSSGAAAIDKQASANGTGGTATSAATAATTAANEYTAGVYVDDGWALVTAASANAATGWTYVLGTGHVAPSGDVYVEHIDSGASGSVLTAALATGKPGGSATWAMFTVIYKLPGAASTLPLLPPPVQLMYVR